MAAMNVEDAARKGRSEPIPPTWTKYLASRDAIRTNLIIYVVGSLLVLGLAIFLLVTGSLPGGTRGDDALAPYEFFALVIFGGLFLWVGLRTIPALLHADRYFFLITNEGFVYVADKKLIGLPFAEISLPYRQSGLLGGKLVVRQTDGKSLVVPLGHLFTTQAVREMEETLIERIKPSKARREKRA
jgi:hypothetical protein